MSAATAGGKAATKAALDQADRGIGGSYMGLFLAKEITPRKLL
jgi:hypothetical protein